MSENYALNNKLANLIPIVNPELKGKRGIEAALLYRLNEDYIEVDRSPLVKEAFETFYAAPIPKAADTIFNAFVPFMDFSRAKLIVKYNIKIYEYNLYQQYKLAYDNLDGIFAEYQDLKELFDEFFDLMYCFSNLMPAPVNFNGSKYHIGKGDKDLNKDYPSEYLKNLNDLNSKVYKREEMLKWLNEHMDEYKIKDMYDVPPPYPISEYYGYNDCKLPALLKFIKTAINLIRNRFKEEKL